MLELRLDSRLPAPLREAYLREARRAGIALADLELLSFDHEMVRQFLAAVRENRASAFVLTLDRSRLERTMRHASRAGGSVEDEDGDAPTHDAALASRS